MLDAVAATLILLGAALALIAGIGLQRFDDVFSRMHSATKPATLGLLLVLAGAALRLQDTGAVTKLALVVVLQFATAPVGSHLVGRAAYGAGARASAAGHIDELASSEQEAGA